jgi:uncharacterized RDD family membrane protein YckC
MWPEDGQFCGVCGQPLSTSVVTEETVPATAQDEGATGSVQTTEPAPSPYEPDPTPSEPPATTLELDAAEPVRLASQPPATAVPGESVTSCAKCGWTLAAGARFCPECGAPVPQPPAPVYCSRCGSKSAPGVSFCAECGSTLIVARSSSRAGASLASFWERFAARLIDSIAIALLGAIPSVIVYLVVYDAVLPDRPFVTQAEKDDAVGAAVWAVAGVLWLVSGVYYVIGWSRGRTWGMAALGLRLQVADTGAQPEFGRALGRFLMSIVSNLALYLGFLWMIWDTNKQTWHDKAAGTLVVKSS